MGRVHGECHDILPIAMEPIFYKLTSVLLCLVLYLMNDVSGLPMHSDFSDDGGDLMAKRKGFDSLSGFTFGKRNFDELDRDRFSRFYKRNFDEIDRAGFGNRAFHKRNFDELDKSGFAAFNRYF